MAPPHPPIVGGEDLGVGGHVGVGELRPTPHTRHNDAARRHWVEVPNPRDTFGEVGVREAPPPPTPRCSCFANGGGAQDPWPAPHSARR